MISFWSRLRGTTPQEPLRIGTVAAVHANGTVTCDMSDGGSLTVRGSASLGDVVYIQFGQVQGTTSGLTTFADQDV